MSSRPHPQCALCEQAYKGINGRYCNVLKKYVEYAATPQCYKKKQK